MLVQWTSKLCLFHISKTIVLGTGIHFNSISCYCKGINKSNDNDNDYYNDDDDDDNNNNNNNNTNTNTNTNNDNNNMNTVNSA